MKCLYSIISTMMLVAIFSYFMPSLNIGKDIAQVLYTVSGIMFSIGMSLAVTFHTNGVNNIAILKQIRKSINHVRNGFICYFIISTILFILLYATGTDDGKAFCYKKEISLNPALAFSIYIIFSIIYYIYNFIKMQNLNTDIEDELRKEKI
jgi:glycerol uptake facilitator-like aquaporin